MIECRRTCGVQPRTLHDVRDLKTGLDLMGVRGSAEQVWNGWWHKRR